MTIYLTPTQAITLHDEAVREFGGLLGIRDQGALESALAQPAMEAFGVELYATQVEKAAAYLFFLSRNHAFNDGNKRTSYLCTATFLLQNGLEFGASDDMVFELILKTAQGQLRNVRVVADVMEGMVVPLA